MEPTDRRKFLKLAGAGATLASTLRSNIAKALSIPANNRTGTIRDVEHIVVLMQENRPFDHHFGTLRGVRGFNDPRAVQIQLPLQSGSGTTLASVFLQPAGAVYTQAGYAVAPDSGKLGGPADGAFVVPPFRVNPGSVLPGLTSLGGTYLPGTDHGWSGTHLAWNQGQYDGWVVEKGPMAMSYMTREDLPYHYALADAFTVGDHYFSSIMGPTNPNRCYLWTGSIGNVDYLGAGGTDGLGAGPVTYNGLSVNNAYYVWETFPEVLEAAGVSWKIYQDLSGATFAPDFGDGGNDNNGFAGNYTDNPVLYFNQYAQSKPGQPLYDKAATGSSLATELPPAGAPAQAWTNWADSLFDTFRNDVNSGSLPQVSWLIGPAAYTEHSAYPINFGAWYISQVLGILVANPSVFSKTVFIVNYDEADGSFDHVVPPTPAPSAEYGASTIDATDEIVTTSSPNGPIGLGTRVPLLLISPWSKGGYVNSQVFDHTSVIRFIERRFQVHERNITAWRRAVVGDLTSAFNFASPNDNPVNLPATSGLRPPVSQLSGTIPSTFVPTPSSTIVGIPTQEKGIRLARALPYEIDVQSRVDVTAQQVHLTFVNTGSATVVFQVRSANAADPVRTYTVEPGKQLAGSWAVTASYRLSVYGPNGFARYFAGTMATGAAALALRSVYGTEGAGSIAWNIRNDTAGRLTAQLLDAYTGETATHAIESGGTLAGQRALGDFHGWYDLVVRVAEDPSFELRLAGHVETGRDSISDPALGGLVSLKA